MTEKDSWEAVVWSESLKKRIRSGSYQEQAISTTTKIIEAIEIEDWNRSADLLEYWVSEALIVQSIYEVWTEGWSEYLSERGMPTHEIEMEILRLRRLLEFPDGTDFYAGSRWAGIVDLADSLGLRMRKSEVSIVMAREKMEQIREQWRQLHDRGADFQSGLLSLVANRFGEAAIGDAYAHVLAPYLRERYASFDVRIQPYEDTLEKNLYLTFEAMRGHLVGPDRNGDMEVVEDDNKVTVSFDPCGSGNRGQRGDAIEGTGSRSDPPYNFGVTAEEHDWAWNEKGVCYYCAHCCFALEYWPAREWGHPIRVVDSPLHPEETAGETPKKCTWTIYKSIEAIPESAYRRIGMQKP